MLEVKATPMDVVMVGGGVPGSVIVANTCVDCPHKSSIGFTAVAADDGTKLMFGRTQTPSVKISIVCGVALPAPTVSVAWPFATMPLLARVIVTVLLLTLALKAGAPAVVVNAPPIAVVIAGAVAPGLMIETKTCVDWPHPTVTRVGDREITGAGAGGSSAPGVFVNVG